MDGWCRGVPTRRSAVRLDVAFYRQDIISTSFNGLKNPLAI